MRFLIINESVDGCEQIVRELRKEFRACAFLQIAGPNDLDAALARADFDGVITDYPLSWTDGLTILRRIKSVCPLMPVVMVTDNGSETLAVEGMKAGLSDYVAKSHLSRLPAAVKESLEKVRQQRDYEDSIEQLRFSEELYHSLSELALDHAFTGRVGPDGTVALESVVVGKNSVMKFSTANSDVGVNWPHLIVPDDMPVAQRSIARLLAGESDVGELRVVKDDETRWIRYSVRPVWDAAAQRVVRIIGAAQDITERKQSESALHESKRQYQLLFETNPLPMWVYDAQTLAIRAVNHAAIQHYGYSSAEFLAMRILDLRPSEEIPALMNHLQKAMPVLRNSGVWKHRKKDGTLIDVEITVHNLVFEGQPSRLVLAHNVTERLRAEEALKESEERYRAFIKQSSEGIWRFELEKPLSILLPEDDQIDHFYRYSYLAECNDVMAQMYGYTCAEDLIGARLDQFLVRSDPQNDAFLRAFIRSGYRQADGESHEVDRHGQFKYFVNNLVAIVENSFIVRVWGTQRDITERKRSEEALRKAELQFRLVWENSPDGMRLTDDQGIVLMVNDAFCRMVGKKKEELEGKLFSSVYSKENQDQILQVQRERFAARRIESHLVREIALWNESNRWFDLSNSFLEIGGAPPQLLSIFRDITDRRRAQEALRESEERYRTLAESSAMGIWHITVEGYTIYVNPAMCALLEVDGPDALVGQTYRPFFSPESLEKVEAEHMKRQQGLTSSYEIEIIGRRGGRRNVVVSGAAIRAADGRLQSLIGTFADITERKRLEAQLRHANKMESIGTLAGGVAHDFNNILTGIIGFSDLALRRLSPQDALYRNLREIQRLGERAAQLTRQLLTFARQQMLASKRINLNQVISDLSQFIQRVIGEHIELRTILADDLAVLLADTTQIEQVLMNLCINARDAMPQGGTLLIETRNVSLDASFCQLHPWAKPGDYVWLSVSDTGLGFDRTTQERIFDPFFTTKEPGQGTGLGLAIVYAIIQQHKGMIDVYSEVGRGTAFKIYLPAETSTTAPTEQPALRAAAVGHETVLIAEDEPVVRELIVKILKAQGYQVLAAANGEEAVRLFDEHNAPIDLIISDAVMPKMGGRGLYEALRGRKPALKFLFISGYSAHALGDRFILDERLSFLHKPFKPLDLAQKVRDVLDGAAGVVGA